MEMTRPNKSLLVPRESPEPWDPRHFLIGVSMKLVNVSQRVPSERGSPVRLKPAGRPVVNPACVWGNPGCGTRGIKDAGRVLSPEICIVVDRRITSTPRRRGKADTLQRVEGSSPRRPAAVQWGHHRGLRPGHASTGETWELGRSNSLLKTSRSGEPGYKCSPGSAEWKRSAPAESERKGWLRGTGRRGYKPKPKGWRVGGLSGT